MRALQVRGIVFLGVVALAGTAIVWAQRDASSRPASRPSHHSSMANLREAIGAIDAANKDLESGALPAPDIDKAMAAVGRTIEELKSCESIMSSGKGGSASQPSSTATMHEGFVKQLQNANMTLDAAKTAAVGDKPDKVKAMSQLKSAKEQINSVIGALHAGSASRPTR